MSGRTPCSRLPSRRSSCCAAWRIPRQQRGLRLPFRKGRATDRWGSAAPRRESLGLGCSSCTLLGAPSRTCGSSSRIRRTRRLPVGQRPLNGQASRANASRVNDRPVGRQLPTIRTVPASPCIPIRESAIKPTRRKLVRIILATAAHLLVPAETVTCRPPRQLEAVWRVPEPVRLRRSGRRGV